MKTRFLSAILITTVAIIVLACSSKKEEGNAQLIDKAVATATHAAQALVATNHTDTLAMQNSILEAKALQAEFQVAEDTAAINAFNRAFKKYLEDHDPNLAREIFIERPSDLPAGTEWDEFEQRVEEGK